MNAQIGIMDEIFVDSFAGGGGASTGIELATGHPIDIAINHDQSAIMMHKQNHPFTEHYREDIWLVDPIKATRGRHVRLAWFSPDCKHFSRAKGAALVDKHIRGLAWVVLRWAGTVRPDVIMLENVPEFVTWGPVRKGKPVKSKAGQTYKKWKSQLEELGYKIETKQLCAADYGAPTIRTRFCLIARIDGKPIKFPERTHAPRNHPDVISGKLKPWRAAAEIINWDLPCYSIFESKAEIKAKHGVNVVRPLKPNTMQRIARGLDKFVIKSSEPFIVPIGYGENKNQKPRVHDINDPLSTVVSSTKQYVCDPVLSPYIAQQKFNNSPQDINEPLSTVTSVGSHEIVSPCLIQYHSETRKGEVRGQDVRNPLMTVDGSQRYGVASAFLSEYYGNARDGLSLAEPVQTITAKDREGITAVHLTQYFGGDGHYHGVDEPLATITTMECEGIVSAKLSQYSNDDLTLSHLAHFKGKDKGQSLHEPLMTVTGGDGQFAEIRTRVVKWDGVTDLHRWEQVRTMLNEYCDYNLADDEILLLCINNAWYFIADIGLRMLSPRELYDAMGFPHDYIIDRDTDGNPITRANQVARCGNAVCPAVAEAMVRANLPECCKRKINSMEELMSEVAV